MERNKLRGKKYFNSINKIFIIIFSVVFLSGCIGVNRSFRQIRQEIVGSLNCGFEREFEFGIGPGGLYIAGAAASFADSDVDVSEIIGNISRVQVSIYEKKGRGKNISPKMFRQLSNKIELYGWDCLVRSGDGSGMTLVFARSGGENILRRMFVVSLDHNELVMAEVNGNLTELLEAALKDDGIMKEIAFTKRP